MWARRRADETREKPAVWSYGHRGFGRWTAGPPSASYRESERRERHMACDEVECDGRPRGGRNNL